MKYILILLLCWIILSSLQIRIKNKKDDTDVLFSFGFFIKFHLDYDKFVNRFSKYIKPDNITISQINAFIKSTFVSKKLYRMLCRRTKIKWFEIDKVVNLKRNYLDPFSNSMFFITTSMLSSYLRKSFKAVKNEKYEILRNDLAKNEYDFDVMVKISVVAIIICLLFNIKAIIKMIKIARSEKRGSSNSYPA